MVRETVAMETFAQQQRRECRAPLRRYCSCVFEPRNRSSLTQDKLDGLINFRPFSGGGREAYLLARLPRFSLAVYLFPSLSNVFAAMPKR